MGNVEVRLVSEGVKALLRSSEMKSICKEYAQKVVSRANASSDGAEYKATEFTGKNRAGASVSPDNPHAYYSNLKHNTLIKALK